MDLEKETNLIYLEQFRFLLLYFRKSEEAAGAGAFGDCQPETTMAG